MKVCQDKPSVREELPSKPLVGMVCQVPKECAGAENRTGKPFFWSSYVKKKSWKQNWNFMCSKVWNPNMIKNKNDCLKIRKFEREDSKMPYGCEGSWVGWECSVGPGYLPPGDSSEWILGASVFSAENAPPLRGFWWGLNKVMYVRVLGASQAVLGSTASQAPLFTDFSRQEYYSGLPFLSPGDLPDPGIKLGSLVFQADSLPSEPLGKSRW